MDDALRDSLVKEGALLPLPEKYDAGNVLYRVKGFEVAPVVFITLSAMTIHHLGWPADTGIGIKEPARSISAISF